MTEVLYCAVILSEICVVLYNMNIVLSVVLEQERTYLTCAVALTFVIKPIQFMPAMHSNIQLLDVSVT